MSKKLFIMLLIYALTANLLYAEALIHSFKTDPRAKVVTYHPNQIYDLKTHYLISTDIIFGKDEWVKPGDYHLGDASSWDIEANRNHLYVKAKKLGGIMFWELTLDRPKNGMVNAIYEVKTAK